MPGVYHSIEDVEALLRTMQSQRGLDFSSGKPVPASDVERWIEETEAIVNERIRHRYVVPVTDPAGVIVLRYICARLTAATVWRLIHSPVQASESAKAQEWESRANELLDRIANGEMTLGAAEMVISTATGGVQQREDTGRIWRLGEVQW